MVTVGNVNYERVVIDSAKDWINGEATIGNQMELVMIADHYGVRLPACMYHFQYSENPNHVCATGAFKTIYKTLDKLAAAINARVNNG